MLCSNALASIRDGWLGACKKATLATSMPSKNYFYTPAVQALKCLGNGIAMQTAIDHLLQF